jgi:hypothetical protein
MTRKEVFIIRHSGRKDRYRVHSAEVSTKDVFQNVFMYAILFLGMQFTQILFWLISEDKKSKIALSFVGIRGYYSGRGKEFSKANWWVVMNSKVTFFGATKRSEWNFACIAENMLPRGLHIILCTVFNPPRLPVPGFYVDFWKRNIEN